MIAKVGYTVAYVPMPKVDAVVNVHDKRLRIATDPIGIVRSKVVKVECRQGFADADDAYEYTLENGGVVWDDECVICGLGEDLKLIIEALGCYRRTLSNDICETGQRLMPLIGALEYEYANADRLNAFTVEVAKERP